MSAGVRKNREILNASHLLSIFLYFARGLFEAYFRV